MVLTRLESDGIMPSYDFAKGFISANTTPFGNGLFRTLQTFKSFSIAGTTPLGGALFQSLKTFTPFFVNVAAVSSSTPSAAVTHYRMRGYYIAGLTHEFWNTIDKSAAPPSGHSLVSIVVERTWTE